MPLHARGHLGPAAGQPVPSCFVGISSPPHPQGQSVGPVDSAFADGPSVCELHKGGPQGGPLGAHSSALKWAWALSCSARVGPQRGSGCVQRGWAPGPGLLVSGGHCRGQAVTPLFLTAGIGVSLGCCGQLGPACPPRSWRTRGRSCAGEARGHTCASWAVGEPGLREGNQPRGGMVAWEGAICTSWALGALGGGGWQVAAQGPLPPCALPVGPPPWSPPAPAVSSLERGLQVGRK